jgi:SulP family sulfate permease
MPGAGTAAGVRTPLVRRNRRTVVSILPVLRWLPRYRWRRDLPTDLLAGFALAALLVPESLGYAGVADVPPEVGLYAALAALCAYAIVGGSSILVVGPASAVAALSASLVGAFHTDVDPVVLTSALAIASGVLLVVAGVLRLGWIVNFISKPVLEAFVVGLSMSIVVGQLDGLLGIEVDGDSAIAAFVDVLRGLDSAHPLTVAIGVGALLALLVLERFAARIPAAVIVVVAGIVAVAVLDLGADGVEVVGEIPGGLPEVAVPDLSAMRWAELLSGGAALLLVGFSEGYASASAVAGRTDEDVDADQELLGSGAANIASGLVGGLPVSGSLSKSAASQAAGARTQVANLVAAAVVLATLLFLAPVFEDLPKPVLAAVVIAAVLRSANPARIAALWAVNRLDFAAGLATFVLVLVWETLPAMIVGVVLSLAFLVRRASFPDVVELGEDTQGRFARVEHLDESVLPETVAVIRLDAPLIYSNAERLRKAALTLVTDRPEVRTLVLDGEMVSDLDITGAETLERLDDDLAGRGVELRIARLHHRARTQLDRSHLHARFAGRLHTTLVAATTRVPVDDRHPEPLR